MKKADHVFELIGHTPMVRINKINPNPRVEIYAKLEGFNPMGSLKDRIALRMIETAEAEGTLSRGKVILEATSGNTGISVAWVSALKGYKCTIVLPSSATEERKKILNALGAELVFVSTEAEAIEKARALAKDPRYYLTDQFANDANWKAHFETTAEEIWQQTEGKVTHFVAGIGTSGTIMGVSRRLKQLKPDIKIIGIHPARPDSKQQGLLNLGEFCPEICRGDELDEVLTVEDEDAYRTARELLLKEGLFVGVSSGSVMWAAVQKAKTLDEGLIVTVFGDHGFKYLSTGLFG
jgi:cysteine synthase